MIAPGEDAYDGLPSLALEQVESGTGAISKVAGSKSGEGRSVNFRFDDRHVLYGKLRPYLNKVALPDFAGRCSTELVPLLPKEGVDRTFLALLLRRQETVRAVMAANTGARMPRADMKVLMSLSVPLPPLPEQRRIVDILNHANSIRRLGREAQEKARQVIPALFVEMFGDPIQNPNGWPMRSLGELVDADRGISYGIVQRGEDVAGGTPVARISNIANNEFDAKDCVRTAPEISDQYKRTLLRGGELLLSIRGSVGRVAMAPKSAAGWNVSREIAVVPLLRSIDGCYLRGAMLSHGAQSFLTGNVRGIAQRGINLADIRKLPVPLAPEDLQHAFAERAADIQSIITQQGRMATASEQIMDALMAKMFQGGAA